MVRKLKATAMAQTLMLGKLPDSPPPHRMWLRLYKAVCGARHPVLTNPSRLLYICFIGC
ncbi:hypothetical protein H6G89_00195 [Oscillatoria sp. FACHB-1407]|uniref:hypothetical protein n=1 Tax=Oscillatoria sp. FACHB-1407 TaxID=2692847 RepID=UPI0016853DA4|nr:hypothetical protein [Oscillatoria sp. FACHB-1407]MBD2459451.1 hypothetical protein [Oscillatoria sp. FACHB-1407]